MADKLQKRKSLVSVVTEPMITTMVSIRMPLEIAEYVFSILEGVGGDPNGPRGKVGEVSEALERAGIVPRKGFSTKGGIYIDEDS